MTPLLTLAYWFQLQPPVFVPWAGRFMVIAFTAMAAVGILAKVVGVKKSQDKFMRRAIERAGSLLLIMGLLGLLMYFFSYERVPLFSMRAFYLLWLIGLAAWAWQLYRYLKVEIPAKRAMQAEREKINKWLPHSSK